MHVLKCLYGWPASGFYPEAAYSPTPRTSLYGRKKRSLTWILRSLSECTARSKTHSNLCCVSVAVRIPLLPISSASVILLSNSRLSSKSCSFSSVTVLIQSFSFPKWYKSCQNSMLVFCMFNLQNMRIKCISLSQTDSLQVLGHSRASGSSCLAGWLPSWTIALLCIAWLYVQNVFHCIAWKEQTIQNISLFLQQC